MSKEVDKKDCKYCESSYKLIYDLDDTSGHPKFCPFCGEENYDDEELDFDDDMDE
jgi:uncharacterized Zn-finger protein